MHPVEENGFILKDKAWSFVRMQIERFIVEGEIRIGLHDSKSNCWLDWVSYFDGELTCDSDLRDKIGVYKRNLKNSGVI